MDVFGFVKDSCNWAMGNVDANYAGQLAAGSSDVKIQGNYRGKILEGAFRKKGNVVTVETGGITAIENEAFQDCGNLERVKLMEVSSIGEKVFSGCNNLEEIEIENNCISVDAVKEALINSEIKKQIQIITNGETEYLYENVTKFIANGLLSDTDDLKIPDFYVNGIEEKAFADKNIKSIDTNNIEFIGDRAFWSCEMLESIKMPNVKRIGKEVFQWCRNLKRIHICNKDQLVMLIDFILDLKETKKREEIVPYQDITDHAIDIYVNGQRLSLEKILKEKISNCYEFSNSVNKIDWANLHKIPRDIEGMTAVGVTEVSADIFKQFESLKYIELNKNVKIGGNNFKDCKSLERISSADGEKFDEITIGAHAFENSGIVSIRASYAPEGIGDEAFCNCKALREVEISKVEGKICSRVFADCNSLERVVLNTEGSKEELEIDLSAFENCNDDVHIEGNYTLKIRVESLYKEYVEKYKDAIEKRIDGDGELKIDNVDEIFEDAFAAFKDCGGFKSINIPKVDLIREGAFRGVKSLEAVTACSDVEVEGFAFENCESLKYVCKKEGFDCNLSDEIGESAFEGTAIASLRVSEIAEIEKKAFYNCRNLEKIEIEAEKISIGEEAFANCPALSNLKIIISDIQNLKIDRSAFNGCDNLKMLSIVNQNYGSVEEFFNAIGLND